jgi:hypothetical protein
VVVVVEFIHQALMQEQVVLAVVVLVEVDPLFLVVLQHMQLAVAVVVDLIVQMVEAAVPAS